MSVSMPESQFPNVAPTAPVQQDYFGFSTAERFVFPDGITYIEFLTMNEGQKRRYQKATASDLVLTKGGNESRLRVDQAEARKQLITMSVTGWNLTRGGVPVQFDRRALDDWLELANPALVEDLETQIRRKNPWLTDEIPSEEIRKEIEALEEQLKEAIERERGEGSSGSR